MDTFQEKYKLQKLTQKKEESLKSSTDLRKNKNRKVIRDLLLEKTAFNWCHS